ncbi:MAG: radical SAM protein [Longimicrobiales bacterium]
MATTELELLREQRTAPASRFVPHVVAWNLTQRCNLACAHCYISAGSWHGAAGELSTTECLRIADQILELNDSPMFILSGGEPLLRDDLEQIAAYASGRGATVVVGTNGTRLTAARIDSLKHAGVKGVAVSIDALDERYHDRFRHGGGALADTLAAVDRLIGQQLDFIVQTTVTRGNRQELARLAAWSAERGAVSFNVYFLVATGRAENMTGLTPAENEETLAELLLLEQQYRGRMLVRSKCMPQIMRHAFERAPDSPLLNYETRCPCGLQYCRITPEGKVTPCPYSPAVAGDLRAQSFGDVWRDSPVFASLRSATLGGKCGRCEYREICGGCRARAFAETGDLLAEDSSCAYEPAGQREPVTRKTAATFGGPASARAMTWTPEAQARLTRIPSFVRGVVTERIERFARERGLDVVTEELMSEIRQSMPGDFSKRLPFFARRRDV